MRYLIGCTLLLFSFVAHAQELFQAQAQVLAPAQVDIYSYNYGAYDRIKKYEGQITASGKENFQNLTEVSANKCLPVYKNAIKNRVFDIRHALGYFDDSQAIDILWNAKNWGLSLSLDIGVYKSIRHTLTDPCENRSALSLCGFTENGNPNYGQVLLEKRIKLLGNNVFVKARLSQASVSPCFRIIKQF